MKMHFSKIILGCEQIGGKDHGKLNFSELTKTFREALKLGINTFDTAGIYNLGKSETNLYKIFKSKVHDINIITKGGLNYNFLELEKRAKVFSQFDESFLRQNIEQSCKRLKLKKIPVFLIHYPPNNKATMIKVCKSLEKFKKERIIENYGFSNIDYKLFNYAYKDFDIYAIENSLNLFNFRDQIKNFKKINRRVKKIAHSVLAQGMLTGKYDTKKRFLKSDRRHRMAFFSRQMMKKNYLKITKLQKIAYKHDTSPTILSLSFLLNCPYLDSIIIGVKNLRQLQSNLSALNYNFNKKLSLDLMKIF